MAQPEVGRSQLEHREEVGGVLFVSRGEPSEVFDPVEEPLDAVARAVEYWAEAGLPPAMNHGGYIRGRTCSFNPAAQPIRIISLVGEDDGIGMQPSEQLFGDRTITRLTRCQHQLERQAACVGQRVDLGRQPAARAADTAIRVAFFELAAC
jgi:hypothetical protein